MTAMELKCLKMELVEELLSIDDKDAQPCEELSEKAEQ